MRIEKSTLRPEGPSLGTKTSVFDLPGVPKRPGVVVFCCCFQCFAFTDCAFTADSR